MPSAEHRFGSSVITTQVIDSGTQTTNVLGLAAEASGSHQPYIAVRVGRVLTYVYDYAALNSHCAAWERARELAETTFGPEPDAFTEAAAAEQRRLDRRRRGAPLRAVQKQP